MDSKVTTGVSGPTYVCTMNVKPLRRPDYVLQMAIDANIAMTLEYIANMCFIVLAAMGVVGVPQFWIVVASVVLAPIALVLIGYSGQRMRRVNEATGESDTATVHITRTQWLPNPILPPVEPLKTPFVVTVDTTREGD